MVISGDQCVELGVRAVLTCVTRKQSPIHTTQDQIASLLVDLTSQILETY